MTSRTTAGFAPGRGPFSADMPPELDARHLVRRLVQIGLAVVVVGTVVLTVPGLEDVKTRLAGARPSWLAVAFFMEMGSILAFVAVFRGVICKHLAWRLSYEIALSEQAANVLLPTGGAGGLALGAWALKRGGMPTEHIARRTVALYVITSSVNFAAAIVSGAALATGLAVGSTSLGLTLGPAVLAMAVMAGVLALPRLLPARAAALSEGRVRRRLGPVATALRDGVHDAVTLVASGQPLVVVGASRTWPSTSRRSPPPLRPLAAADPHLPPSCSPTRSASSVDSSPCPAASAAPTAR